MTLIFPIVGVGHCIPEEEACDLIAALPDGAEVSLMYDHANAYDRYAIQAWMELEVDGHCQKMQVGYVSADYAPMIRHNYPDAKVLYAYVVHPETSVVEDNSFEVEIELDKMEIPAMEKRIDLSKIANIHLPTASPERSMVWEEVIHYSQGGEIEAQEVLTLAEKSEAYLGHGLSGEERTAYILLSTMLAHVHGWWSSLTEEIWQMRMTLDGAHRDAYKTPEKCAQIMEEEMQRVKGDATSFFEQYKAALKAGLTTKEKEKEAHQQWLKALPDNLYAYLEDRPQLAIRLYYERFSMEELQAIYLHILCIEWLKEKKKTAAIDKDLKQRINDFPYWGQYARIADKERAVEAMHHALYGSGRYPIADLALAIKKLQKNEIIEQHWDLFANFVSALNALLGANIKANSLARHFR